VSVATGDTAFLGATHPLTTSSATAVTSGTDRGPRPPRLLRVFRVLITMIRTSLTLADGYPASHLSVIGACTAVQRARPNALQFVSASASASASSRHLAHATDRLRTRSQGVRPTH